MTIESYCLLCSCNGCSVLCLFSGGGSTNLLWVGGLFHVFNVSSGGLLVRGHFS